MGNLVSITSNIFVLVPFFFIFIFAEAQSPGSLNSNDNVVNGFRPSLAVVIGILSIMFSLTFLLLIYAKFCHRPLPSDFLDDTADHSRFSSGGLLTGSSSRFSGIDKTVIESLPYFRFSTLEGAGEGLECAVCLSKFEDIEILRLLPKCKHAFHIDCVDRWLENHSSCPLCRHKVDPSDITIFTASSNSLRISRNPSDLTDDHNIELFVRREQDPENYLGGSSSSRFSIGSSFRRIEKGKKLGEELPIQEEQPVIDADDRNLLDKFNRRIIVSDVVFKNRWSDVNSSDLMLLNSEMLRFSSLASSSERFTSATAFSDKECSSNEIIMKIKEEMEKKKVFESKLSKMRTNYSFSSKSNFPSSSGSELNPNDHPPGILVPTGARSVSEIVSLSRCSDYRVKNRIREASSHHNGKDERLRKVWLPIARRTVQWFAGREKRSQHPQYTSNE